MTDELRYEVRGRAAWMTIDRPERRNALSGEAIAAFQAGLDRAEDDPDVRVICVTGAGEKVFCSGADLMSSFTGGDATEGMRAFAALLGRFARYPKPLVARVNGHCLAGGLGLLLSCDIAYAVDSARFWTPELGVGLFPMMIGALIFRNMPRKQALEMIYTGRKYTADQAVPMGLITGAFAAGDLDSAVDEAVGQIAANAPLAMKLGRKALADVEDLALEPALDHLCDMLGEVAQTEDAAEGLMAFMQKRAPEWKGR